MAEKKGTKVTITSKKKQKPAKKATEEQAAQKDTFRLVDLPDELAERAREIWLAGLGALSAVEKEGARVFSGLVEKGEAWERESRGKLGAAVHGASEESKEMAEELDRVADRLGERLAGMVETSVEGALRRLGVPTRAEVTALAERVEGLSKRIDTMLAAKPGRPDEGKRTGYHVVPHEDGWAVKKEDADRAASVHGTKEEAVEAGRALARQHEPSRLVVHKKDATIQNTYSYGD